ncbi:metabotropic glutamate receptor 3-like [Liolophura sinensis]|uniref:metabotropic glutamate receptor 3-like n=1 Tax=Liolophura sinensis TaxID=3198878 RepID=UPI00315955D9
MKILLCLVVMMTTVHCQPLTSQTCASRRMVNIGAANPNVVIGGLFPLRTRGFGNYGCGPVGDAPYNMQAFEAARFALARINGFNPIPGVTLGMVAYDTCSSGSVATRAVSEFLPHLTSSSSQCTVAVAPPKLVPGIIGGHFGEVTKSVASFLQGFDVAQVAYSSRLSEFSDVFHYPNLLRTDAPPRAVAEVSV